MLDPELASARPVMLTREGSVFRLAFKFDQHLVNLVKALPYANFDREGTRSWNVLVCQQSVRGLRNMFSDGLVDVYVDDLLAPGEDPPACKLATLRSGSATRPYVVSTATRDDSLYARLTAITGAQWNKALSGIAYPPGASVALAELVNRGILDDPDKLLSPAETVVSFDGRTGEFVLRGDRRAQTAFDKFFPDRDVVALWQSKGLDVAFSDPFTEEIYRGELARVGPGFQPEGMALDLFEHQRRNVAIALERTGFGIFDAPGVGKTASGIGASVALIDRELVNRVIVVVPGAVRTQWAREIARFCGMPTDSKGRPISSDVVVVMGDKKKRTEAYVAAKNAKWMIVNYDVLSRDFKMIAPLSSGALIVLDEAHRAKNPTAQRTKAIRQLGARAARRIALTGTPVENDPGEWFSLISGFLNPGVFGSYTEYGGRYQYANQWGGFEGARNLRELRQRSRVYFARHTKAQVAKHLPPLRVQHLPLDPDPAYATALRRAHKEARDEIKMAALERTGKAVAGKVLNEADWDDVETGAEMTAVQLLRAMTSSPRLIHLSDSPAAKALVDAELVPDIDGPKLDELRIMAAERQAAGDRLVVFTYSAKMAGIICQRLTDDKIRHVSYTGATSNTERDEAVLVFTTPGTESDPGPTVFVATDAAAEGLNLGACCSTLVNLDVPYTPARLEQRSNRIHRIDGTSDSYLVINLTLMGTIEHGLLRMVETKADLQDAIFGEKGGRKKTTGRGGRGVFEQAMQAWDLDVDPQTLDGQYANAA